MDAINHRSLTHLGITLATFVVAAVLLSGCHASQRWTLPAFANPANSSRLDLITSGRIPAGATNSQPYWLFGGSEPFAEMREDFVPVLLKNQWTVLPSSDSADAAVELRAFPPSNDFCITYVDFRATPPPYPSTVYYVKREPGVERAGDYSNVVLVTVSSCG